MHSNNILSQSIEYLKGVGPKRAELLKKELGVFTCRDLLFHYPFRYEDRTKFHKIRDLNDQSETVQLRGIIRRMDMVGDGRKRRLVARLRDDTGAIELVWFQGATWIEKKLLIGTEYIVYGKINSFNGKLSIPHPEIEAISDCLLYTSPSPRDQRGSRMPSSA